MKNIQNKLFLASITMLAVIFMTSGCEFESAGDVSKDVLQPIPLLPSCDDGIDNNGDGNTDLADSGCDPNGDGIYDDATGEFYLPFCNDGVNNDSTGADGIAGSGDEDTLIDLLDSDCRLSEGGTGENFTDAPVLPSFCEDGLDNDLDGTTDLDDTDCVVGGNGETPAAPKENCADGIDNDGDGDTDAADTADCTGDGLGETYLPNCNDGIDQDEDGLTDLDGLDPDCLAISNGGTGTGEQVPPPEAPAEPNCEDGIDNDGDGLTDDDDTESCVTGGGGETYLPNCNDGINQDNDEFTDLLDLDCQAISNGGTGTGEFIPIVIPEEVGETNNSGEELANSVPEDATPEQAAAAIEGTPAGDVIAASTELTNPETEEGQANALAVDEIKTALVDDLAGGAGTGLTDPVTVAAFTNAITDSISANGVLPGAVVSESIDELMADVADDPVLAALLAEFVDVGGGRGSGPPVSPPLLYKSFGTQGYEECVEDCNDTYATCSAVCFSGVQAQYDACTSTANTTHSECSADIATNFTACNANAETGRTSCIEIISTTYDQCVEDLTQGGQAGYAACMATNQGTFDNCEAGAGSALGSCDNTASINKTSCDQAALDQNEENVNTAMEQFNQMMAMSVTLSGNPALAGYAVYMQTMALCLFMNNIMVAVEIKDGSLGDCSDSQGIEEATCASENTTNLATCTAYLDDSGCNDYLDIPTDNACVAYQSSQLGQCDTQYSNNMDVCVDNQDLTNTACSAGLTSALNECQEILSGLDCGNCSDEATVCIQTCHDEAGSGGGG